MDPRLHEAALTGDVNYLKENAHILDGAADFAESPLHIAALFGHVEFAKEILKKKLELARVLDSDGSSPLHLASVKGHIEIVKELLKIDTDMCLVRDKDGRTPLHAAVLKGRLEVVKVLVAANRIATLILTAGREPILHLCVKHNQFEILKELLKCVEAPTPSEGAACWSHQNGEYDKLVKMKDDDDNTILHLAVEKKHIPEEITMRTVQLTKFLLQETKMSEEVNALNSHGFTALDVLRQKRSKSKDMKLLGLLRGAEAKRAKAMQRNKDDWTIRSVSTRESRWKKHIDWLNETRSALMVVAVLIATITFQAGINPPGGVWQEDKIIWDANLGKNRSQNAGESIMADEDPDAYISFSVFNGVAFIASLSIILLVIAGFHIKRRIFMWALMIMTWMAVSSMIVTYCIALATLSSDETAGSPYDGHIISIVMWIGLNGLLFVAQFIRFIIWLARKVTTLIYTWTFRNKQPSNGSDKC